MKRILFTVCMLLGCVLFTMAQDKGYKIEGRLANTVNGKLLLVVKMDKGTIDISEADVTNGVFEFTGRMPEMTLVYLMPVKKNAVLASFMLENANYTITMGANELIVESDGEAQKVWKEFYDLDKYLQQSQQQLDMQARANPPQLQRLQQEFKKIAVKVEADELALIKKHNDSPVSAFVIASKLPQSLDEVKLAERYDALSEKAKATSYGKQIAADLEMMKKVAVGEIAPNFSAPLADGGVLSLHETKAKVKVVDFWASWCGPCRGEIPHLRHVSELYEEGVFHIISISIDEREKDWKRALKQEKMTWTQLNDRKGMKGPVPQKYKVNGVPFSLILDKEGRIVAGGVRGAELDNVLIELIGDKY